VLFFGERTRRTGTHAALDALAAAVRRLPGAPEGPQRHAELARVLVQAGAISQGLADAERAAAGADDDGARGRAALDATADVAAALWASWNAGGRAPAPALPRVAALARLALPEEVELRRPEGFAFYATYPETWAAAGRALEGQGALVLGIRSIGTALAAMVAAGAGVAAPAATVRPVGHPFRREVVLGRRLAAALAAARDRPAAVADEGPGLSGSSFAAVLAALEALGIPPQRVHLFPSHAGEPGPEAPGDVRERYARAQRHVVPFEALFLGDHPLALPRLAADVIGPAESPPEDLSAGAWRRHLPAAPRDWPPSQGWRERRKYLLRAGGRTWIARFAGLGDTGAAALARARTLADAGLAAAPAALRHGFLFSPWLGDARPAGARALPRAFLLAAFRRYLTFVAAAFPADPRDGATPEALLEMARVNAGEALGADARAGLDRAARLVGEVREAARPVAVDGKVDPWEWLVLPDGHVLKADALDHHGDHALPGCQDVLWDVAGVELAFELAPAETRALADAVRAAAPGAPPRTLPFYRVCRAAFEVARWTLASGDPGLDADESSRRRAAAERAVRGLRQALAGA
jgi:hypothetical protein